MHGTFYAEKKFTASKRSQAGARYQYIMVPYIGATTNTISSSGNIMTVSGARFNPFNTQVYADKAPCVIQSITETQITCLLTETALIVPDFPNDNRYKYKGNNGAYIKSYPNAVYNTLPDFQTANSNAFFWWQQALNFESPFYYYNLNGPFVEVISTFFTPKFDGYYNFSVSSKGRSELWISEAGLNNPQRLAYVPANNSIPRFLEFDFIPEQVTQTPLFLSASKTYLLEGIHESKVEIISSSVPTYTWPFQVRMTSDTPSPDPVYSQFRKVKVAVEAPITEKTFLWISRKDDRLKGDTYIVD